MRRDSFDAAERALDAAREERARARRDRYAARQEHDRAAAAVDRLQRVCSIPSALIDGFIYRLVGNQIAESDRVAGQSVRERRTAISVSSGRPAAQSCDRPHMGVGHTFGARARVCWMLQRAAFGTTIAPQLCDRTAVVSRPPRERDAAMRAKRLGSEFVYRFGRAVAPLDAGLPSYGTTSRFTLPVMSFLSLRW